MKIKSILLVFLFSALFIGNAYAAFNTIPRGYNVAVDDLGWQGGPSLDGGQGPGNPFLQQNLLVSVGRVAGCTAPLGAAGSGGRPTEPGGSGLGCADRRAIRRCEERPTAIRVHPRRRSTPTVLPTTV